MSEKTEIIEDYLKVDKELPGQNYVCLSFVSPNKVLKQKETFYLHKFLQANAEKYGLDESKVAEEYDNFLYRERTELDKEFDKKVDFQTSIRGLKVRGVFGSYKEAEIRSKVLQRMDDVHHIFIGQVGYWLPWDPEADYIEKQEFVNNDLNRLMKSYKDNQNAKEVHYQEELREKKTAALQKNLAKTLKESDSVAEALESGQQNESTPVVMEVEEVEETTTETTTETSTNPANGLESEDPWMARKNAEASQ